MEEKSDDGDLRAVVIRKINPELAEPGRMVQRKSADEVVVQLNLNVVDFGNFKRMAEAGLVAMEKRLEDLRDMKTNKTFDWPLKEIDIDMAISRASTEISDGTRLLRNSEWLGRT
jgi:hypothetical protein